MYQLRIFLLTLLFFPIQPILGQTFSFQHIGVEEGLSQSAVTTVIQDNSGVIWIGTMSGLNRYDGSKFRTYGKEDGLSENWITSSLKDKRGNLWFGHWGGGISMYDSQTGKVRDMHFEEFSKFRTITSMQEDDNGDIWFGTDGGGVFKYESDKNEVVTLRSEDGFLSNSVRAIEIDQRGNIWFGTDKGVIILKNGKQLEDRDAFMVIDQSDGLASDKVSAIAKAGEDKMAVGTEFSGITLIGNAKDGGRRSYHQLNVDNGLTSNFISCLFSDNNEELWLGSRDEGLMQYKISKGRIQKLSVKQGLNYFKVNTIVRDREDNIWIGTDLGLNLFRGDQFLMYNATDGIANNVIWALAEDVRHNIWVGTNAGLTRISPVQNARNKESYNIEVVNYTTSTGLGNNVVLSVFAGKDGKIWCGTRYGGISVLDENGRKIKRLDSLSGLPSNTIYSLTGDKEGNIWGGSDKGVVRISPDFSITSYNTADGLGGLNNYKVFCDSRGTVWFASIGGYLSCFRDDKFIRVGEDQLKQMFITSISEDPEGRMWFGAYGAGVFMYDNQKFTNYHMGHGLSSNSPVSIACDKAGNIWIGTNKGIDKFDPKQATTKTFGEKEGFMGVEPNPNAVCFDHNGNIWFGTIMGVVKFNLSAEKKNAMEPVTFLENIKVGYEPFEFPDDSEFDYDENHITFHYIGVSLTNPDHVEYKFMLNGFDRDWSPVTRDQDVIYSNLPPGEYEFKVMASNNDGKWNELPARYSFVINPPFWQTWWFYTICVIALSAAIYIGDKVRMKKLMTAKALLEKKVEERTAEVVEQKNIVEEKNREILDSIKYAKRIQEAILPPLKIVKEFLPESFILYKPKDIVAGDFYWFESKGDDLFIAAADCTGHGVPGAMVSVVCANSLNRAVNELNLREPAEILNKTRELVVSNFEKSERQVQDGMDISFCRINLKTRKLYYSGAHNPVYRVTELNGQIDEKLHRTESHALLEYKGDKQPIGKFTYERPFTQQEVELKKGDCLYLSTDGFADQFGGENEKKFMYKHFKQMFLNIHQLPMDKQRTEIDRIFESWKGTIVQIDDVCVIGIKIV